MIMMESCSQHETGGKLFLLCEIACKSHHTYVAVLELHVDLAKQPFSSSVGRLEAAEHSQNIGRTILGISNGRS